MMNWKESLPPDCQVRSVFRFLTKENNSGAKNCCCSCTAYGEENVTNLKNVQQWQSMFREGRSNIYDDTWEAWLIVTLNETV